MAIRASGFDSLGVSPAMNVLAWLTSRICRDIQFAALAGLILVLSLAYAAYELLLPTAIARFQSKNIFSSARFSWHLTSHSSCI
jgi:hypothetical protein